MPICTPWDIASAMFTVWSGLGQTLATLCWAMLVVYLLMAVKRVTRPAARRRETADVARWGASRGCWPLHVVMMYRPCPRRDDRGPNPESSRHGYGSSERRRPLSGYSSRVPNIAFNALYARLPAHERTGWIRWLRVARDTHGACLLASTTLVCARRVGHQTMTYKVLLTIYGTAALLVGDHYSAAQTAGVDPRRVNCSRSCSISCCCPASSG